MTNEIIREYNSTNMYNKRRIGTACWCDNLLVTGGKYIIKI